MTIDQRPFTWSRRGGYEVSSVGKSPTGDARFSAFNAIMPDGRTLECHYQCDVKSYDVGGTNWRLGKGKPALYPGVNLEKEYLALWRQWASHNVPLMRELYRAVRSFGDGCTLSDCFASTPINQARALSIILNEWSSFKPSPESTADVAPVVES